MSNNFPEILEYKLYHAQSLHKAGKLDAAFRIAETIQKTHLEQKVTQLISSIYYSKNNLKKASEILKTGKITTLYIYIYIYSGNV